MIRPVLVFLMIAPGLAGCGAINPYATAPAAREAKAPADAGPRVAICYNMLRSSLDQVRAAAQADCAPNTTATPVETDWYLQTCPLLLPARATFVCAPQK
ncbi:MAG TPA: hypothetical protein VHU15_18490 [Stellaceae bacterium]|jgi:hypothetical protein|nr:hypothetical protein [Stellaceae bacterium]